MLFQDLVKQRPEQAKWSPLDRNATLPEEKEWNFQTGALCPSLE